MKKIWFAVILLFITGCNTINSYQKISLNTFKNKVNNKDSFVLILGSATCGYCESYKYTVDEIIKENQINVYYIDIYNLSEKQVDEIVALTNFGEGYQLSTPTTLFFKDGVEDDQSGYNRIIGNKDKEFVENKLRINGYIE